MSVRSVVLGVFAEYVRFAGGSIPLGRLSQILEAMSIQPETTRTIMTRLRSEGWFASQRDGRQVTYSITPYLYSVIDEGRQRIFGAPELEWDGLWHLVMYQIPEEQRALRESLRKRLTFLGFGSPTASTWLAVRDLRSQVEMLMLDLGIEDTSSIGLLQLMSRTESAAVDRQIARRCWDLDRINAVYLEWVRTWHERVRDFGVNPPRGAQALSAHVDLIGEYRRFPFSDPGLPPGLLPTPWHGKSAYTLFTEGHSVLYPFADRYFEEITGLKIERGEAGAPTRPNSAVSKVSH